MNPRHLYFHKVPQVLNFTSPLWHSSTPVHVGISQYIYFFPLIQAYCCCSCLFSEFFTSFTEFCWETRLLTPNLCTCGSFLPSSYIFLFFIFFLTCVWRLWYYALAAILLFLNWQTTKVGWLTKWPSWLAVFFCG